MRPTEWFCQQCMEENELPEDVPKDVEGYLFCDDCYASRSEFKLARASFEKCIIYNAETGLYYRARKDTATSEMPFYWDDERNLWVINPLWTLNHTGVSESKGPRL